MIELKEGKITAEDCHHKPYTITEYGFYTVVSSNIGLTVIWDHKNFFVIKLEPHYMVSQSNWFKFLKAYENKSALFEADTKTAA